MISLYRITHYPNHDFIEYQGEESDKNSLQQLGFHSRQSDRGYDSNFTFRLEKDQHYVDRAQVLESYLRHNYRAPEVRLSLFQGSTSLPDDRPREEWKSTITRAIFRFLMETGERVLAGPGMPVIHGNPTLFEEVHVRQVIEWYVWVDPEWRPWVRTDAGYKYFMNGKQVSMEEIKRQYPENHQIARDINRFTTRSTDELFDQMKEFVEKIGTLDIAGGLSFDPRPVPASQAQFETWYWLHDTGTALMLGKGLESHLAQSMEYQGSTVGVFSYPENLEVAVFHPSSMTDRRLCWVSDWAFVGRALHEKLRMFIPDLNIPVQMIPYQIDSIEQAGEALRETIGGDRRPWILLFIPPEWARDSDDDLWKHADKQTSELRKIIHQNIQSAQCWYISTLDWTLAHHTRDLKPALTSELLKGLCVLGCQPWKVVNIPLEGYSARDVAFIGLDAALQPAPRFAGTIFDSQGVLLGARVVPISRDEFASSEELLSVIERLLGYYKQRMGHLPRHLIVHRDGDLKDDLTGFRVLSEEVEFSFDLVEVAKSGAPRVYQVGNTAGTPSAGIAVGRNDIGLAYINNTHSVQRGGAWPAPNALRVRKVEGPTSIRTLAEQVFWLSRMHIGSFNLSQDLPVTTAYADVLASWARDKRGWGSVIDPPSSIPYFL